jgi:GC-rich sequence DNA-binding factor
LTVTDACADLADFTGASDRLHLGKSANKAAARRLKGEIGEMIADRWVGLVGQRVLLILSREDEDEDDEEANEWELAQVRRAAQWEEEVKPEKVVVKGYVPVPSGSSRYIRILLTWTQYL